MEAYLVLTYRCNAKCYMCNIWQHPSKKDKEFTPKLANKIANNLDDRFSIIGNEKITLVASEVVIKE